MKDGLPADGYTWEDSKIYVERMLMVTFITYGVCCLRSYRGYLIFKTQKRGIVDRKKLETYFYLSFAYYTTNAILSLTLVIVKSNLYGGT